MPLSEFDLIGQYFARHRARRSDVVLGIGDDGAILRVPPDRDLVVSTDTLVAGVHFFESCPPQDIGYKALAVNLSDLAAMGAQPTWATMALTLPAAQEAWLGAFARGFFELADTWALELVGGDINRGPLSVTITVHGLVPKDSGLRRSGARAGDGIYVTGTLGDAALALAVLRGEETLGGTPYRDYLVDRLQRPSPRIAQGYILRELASGAIDVSDGLVADLGHLLRASGVGAVIETARLPLSAAMENTLAPERAWDLALTGGDDYELCFTIPEGRRAGFEAARASLGCPVNQIGRIGSSLGLSYIRPDGGCFKPRGGSYRHF